MLVTVLFMAGPLLLMAERGDSSVGPAAACAGRLHTVEAYFGSSRARPRRRALVLNTDLPADLLALVLARRAHHPAHPTVGLPTALATWRCSPARRRNLLVFLVTIPFWTNLLVRNYAWILLLRNNGLIDRR